MNNNDLKQFDGLIKDVMGINLPETAEEIIVTIHVKEPEFVIFLKDNRIRTESREKVSMNVGSLKLTVINRDFEKNS